MMFYRLITVYKVKMQKEFWKMTDYMYTVYGCITIMIN